MREGVIASMLLLAFTTDVQAQFFDFYQPTRTYNVQTRTTQRFEYEVIPDEKAGAINVNQKNKNRQSSDAYVDTFHVGDDPFAYLFGAAEREESRLKSRTTKPPKRLNSSQATSKSRGNNNKSTNNNNKDDLRNHENLSKKKIVNSDINSDNDIYKEIRQIHKITTKSPGISSHSISVDSSNRNLYDPGNYFANNQGRYYNSGKPSYTQSAKPNFYDRPEYESPNFGYQPIYNTELPNYSNRRPEFNEDRPEIHSRPGNSYTTEYPIFVNQRPDYNEEPNYNNPDNSYQDTYHKRPANKYPRPIQSPNYNDNTHTTESSYLGVKPIQAQGPPITNKPVNGPYTEEPIITRDRPDDLIKFPGPDDGTPDLVQGPDVDQMTAAQRRRYEQLLDKKCESYKSGDNKQGAAIPLLPSPSPVVFNVSRCPPQSTPLIVGGRRVTVEQFPHAAELGWPRIEHGGYSWKCGGSLISEQFVLTAAHCAYQERDDAVVSGPPRVVQLGSSYLDDPGALVVRVRKVIRHPLYKIPKAYHDLALLKLFTRVEFSEVIGPACVGSPPPAGESIIAIGWGRTAYSGSASHELRGVSIPVWELGACARALGTSRKLPDGPAPDSQLCAGDERGERDTCQGDSGGGAVVRSGCRWAVVGVTSVGRACGAPRTPALYATPARAFIGAVLDQA